MITAIACQETGSLWSPMLKAGLSRDRILELCVGDTLDDDKGRRAFPRNRAELEQWPQGKAMFQIAHQGLIDMAAYVPGYSGVAAKPNKFCHGFGIFQYDLQFFKVDPKHFLEKRYASFDACLAKCLSELKRGVKVAGLQGRSKLTDFDMACVAIAYNTGRYNPKRGLEQGHFSGGRYYGQLFFDHLAKCRTVADPGETEPSLPAPAAGEAALTPSATIAAAGATYRVETTTSTLRLRRTPEVPATRPNSNILAELPDGHPVRGVSDKPVKGFLEVETLLNGALMRGFCSTKYLVKTAGTAPKTPAATPPPPKPSAPEAHLVRKSGVTRRKDPANAMSLNEPGMPRREGTDPEELRQEIAAVIDWIAVDNPAHARYQPTRTATFCNIYAHDVCSLAGAYLPRVWWTPKTLMSIAGGARPEPKYADTVFEMRANDLFRWLTEFGPGFGWRRAASPTELQNEVNKGALGLIIARRKVEGRSGHVVLAIPEGSNGSAVRDASGSVVRPLQSQAGSRNFRRGTGSKEWWKGEEFADFAFWLHA
ncbi:hypothetical protein N0B44_07810 [Roseibacterium beibuensis]|uniref:hypothetical protein n=1 Tax=[Roseibacterium] beibuensis TaxID=1193142 RepID=UPI00217D4883|nr:hypothetical protein [Roseibacterium beibuensis]MCS6622811.1 hypothetical protein [Roseibacterium beibuensis]